MIWKDEIMENYVEQSRSVYFDKNGNGKHAYFRTRCSEFPELGINSDNIEQLKKYAQEGLRDRTSLRCRDRIVEVELDGDIYKCNGVLAQDYIIRIWEQRPALVIFTESGRLPFGAEYSASSDVFGSYFFGRQYLHHMREIIAPRCLIRGVKQQYPDADVTVELDGEEYNCCGDYHQGYSISIAS